MTQAVTMHLFARSTVHIVTPVLPTVNFDSFSSHRGRGTETLSAASPMKACILYCTFLFPFLFVTCKDLITKLVIYCSKLRLG